MPTNAPSHRHGLSRTLLLTGAVALVSAVAAAENAPPPSAESDAEALGRIQACVSAFEAGQKSRGAGKLLSARTQFLTCAQESCPDAARRLCTTWLRELETQVPSVVVQAQNARGQDIADARVLLDGKLLATQLDGRPLSVDPGKHTLRVEPKGQPGVEQPLLVITGQQNRRVTVRVGPVEPSGPTRQPEDTGGVEVPPLAWVGIAATALGVVVGAITGGVAVSNKSQLEDDCATIGCTQDDIDRGAIPAHVSTGSFILAGVGAVVGVVSLVVANTGEPASEEVKRPPSARVFLGLGQVGLRVGF